MLLLFNQFLANAGSFHFGEVVDEEFAFEVIHFVLDADGEEAFGVHFERLTVLVQ